MLLRSLALAACALLTAPALAAQNTNCDFQLSSQAEVDAFDCTTLSVLIISGSDITNLDGLSELTSTSSYLAIEGNPQLANVAGLSALTSVGSFFTLRNNSQLANVDGLSSLTSIGGALVVSNNDQLVHVDGLRNLDSVTGSSSGGLAIAGNSSLERCAVGFGPILTADQADPSVIGQPNLFGANASGGDCNSEADILAAYVPAVQPCESLSLTSQAAVDAVTCTEVTGSVSISGTITDLSGLSELQRIGGNLNVVNTEQLTSLAGLESLQHVGGYLQVLGNDQLSQLDALASLTSVTGSSVFGLFIFNNPSLERCAVGLGPLLVLERDGDTVIGGSKTFSFNGTALPGGTSASDCNAEQSILDAHAPPGGGGEPVVTGGSLAAGTCPDLLPAGHFSCRVEAGATLQADGGQRYTVFLRIAQTGRVAFRGEVKPQPGVPVSESVKFTTKGSDPSAFTLELVAEQGSVAAPSAAAEVIATLAFTKASASLRVAERLTAFPNPAASQATLRFAVAEAGEATLVLYDALGREVARPVDGAVEGAVTAELDASRLAPGLYVARLATDARTETVRLTVTR